MAVPAELPLQPGPDMPQPETVPFGDFTLVPGQRQLLLRGTPVALGARAFDLLATLVARRGQVLGRGELLAAVWPGTVVEDNNLAAQVSALRKVLAQDPAVAGSLQTVPRRGYCFAAPIAGRAGAPVDDAAAPQADAPSLVVLPFADLSGHPVQAAFALGLSQTVATDLSRIAGLLVIASATAATFAGRGLDARQVARELGVHHVLTGAVLRQGHRVRINAQLVDGRTGLQRWADRFDGDDGDLFALEDRITGRIANAIGREVFVAAARDTPLRPGHSRCSDLVLRGIAADNQPQSLAVLREQQALFAAAVALDPDHADALARLARAILLQVTQGHALQRPDEATLARGIEAAERAAALAPGNARVHYAMGLVHVLRGEFERAVLANQTAIALDRNFALAHNNLGNSLVHLGRGQEALAAADTALRLDPRGPQVGAVFTTLGFAHLLLGEPAAAAARFEQARLANPRLARAQLGAAVALALDGQVAAAQRVAAGLLQQWPHFRLGQTMDACGPESAPAYRRFHDDVLRPGAQRAGLPL